VKSGATMRNISPDHSGAKEMVDDFDTLAARLRVLEDEKAILATLHRYGHAMDYGPDSAFVACFVADGTWDVRMRRSGAGFACHGHGEIAASLAAQMSVRVPALFAKHIVVDPLIDLDGIHANVVSYFLRVEPRNDGPTRIVASGRYLDRMTRSNDGFWRFEERIAEIDDM
jgi:SnoaL-like domain